MSQRGVMIAAPSSGAGKTTLTLGLLQALARIGPVRGAKSGPDYIDPKFHEAASGQPCLNLDAWAMTPNTIQRHAHGETPLVLEAAMGLFDGAPPDGRGSAADLAKILNIPVILVVDCAKSAQSIAALIEGFVGFDREVKIVGAILNKIGSRRHEKMIRTAIESANGPRVLGCIPRIAEISQPSRHLGLVQASEREDLGSWLDRVADIVSQNIDLEALPFAPIQTLSDGPRMPPPAQRIALANDVAFAFSYPHLLNDWRSAGAEIIPFSPLNNDPVPDADLIYLPGGYPELHAGKLTTNSIFLNSLKRASESIEIYGECGGYMVLGDGLVDAQGIRHPMAGLLRLETSFETRKLHLGYRFLHSKAGAFKGNFTGHEFHYATTLKSDGHPLFEAQDAEGNSLKPMGLRIGKVGGSFAHIIDKI